MDGSRCDASNRRAAQGRFVLEVSQPLSWQFVFHFLAASCMRTLILRAEDNSSAAEKTLRNYRFTYCWEQASWQLCFDHAASSEWSYSESPTVSAVKSIPIS